MNGKVNDLVPGRKPGSFCLVCNTGRLLPAIRTESGGGGMVGGPRGWSRQTISHLSCRQCSLQYEVETKFRELNLEKHLEGQTSGFENPAHKPERCPACDRELSTGTITEDSHFRHNEVRTVATYHFCDICFTVCWVEKHKRPDAKQRHPDDV